MGTWEGVRPGVGTRGRARAMGVGAACAVSLAAGLGMVFKLVTPESVQRLGTVELAGLLGLLVMPPVVAACVRYAGRGAAGGGPGTGEGSGGVREIVVIAPDVRDRTARRHRRLHAVGTREGRKSTAV